MITYVQKGYTPIKFTGDVSVKLNELAREQMKLKLLADIRIDMEICKLEGWDIKEYLSELHKLIDDLPPPNQLK